MVEQANFIPDLVRWRILRERLADRVDLPGSVRKCEHGRKTARATFARAAASMRQLNHSTARGIGSENKRTRRKELMRRSDKQSQADQEEN